MVDNPINKVESSSYWYYFVILGLVSTIMCMLNINIGDKNSIILLPLAYTIVSFIFRSNYKNLETDVPILLIQLLFLVRLVVLPWIYSYNINTQLFEGRQNVSPYISHAVMLMIYEFVIVQSVIVYCKQKHDRNYIEYSAPTSSLSSKFIWIITLYVLLLMVAMPQYSRGFKSILELSTEEFTSEGDNLAYTVGSAGRILQTLFTMGFQIFRIMFPALLIQRFQSKHSYKSSLILLAFCCGIQFFFLTSTFAEALVACLSIILFFISIYPESGKRIMSTLGLGTLSMVFIYFTVRYAVKQTTGVGMYDTSSPLVYAAQIMNAYFTGIDNVAAIFYIPEGFEFEALKADLLGAIPFNNTLFGNVGNKLQFFYNAYGDAFGQIPPTIAGGYYYFGTILSPLFSALFTYYSIWFYRRAKVFYSTIRFVPNIFCSIVFALGCVMYNSSIALQWIFSWGVPMLMITYPFSFLNSSKR